MNIYTFICNKSIGIIGFAPYALSAELNVKIQQKNEDLAFFYYMPLK